MDSSTLESTSNSAITAKGIIDCHMHLIGPEHSYPFSPGKEGLFPEWGYQDYAAFSQALGITHNVITQTPFYGFDNSNLVHGLEQMSGRAKGIAVVNAGMPDEEFKRLQKAGVVGANFYLMKGGELDWSVVAPTNERIQDFEWQTQLQFNGRESVDRLDDLKALKGTVVFDHIGKFQPTVKTTDTAFRHLCTLLEKGNFYIKLSAPYESSSNASPYFGEAGDLASFLIKEFPDRVIWGSNWPHLGLPNIEDWPNSQDLLQNLVLWGADEKTARKILLETPSRLFKFKNINC